MICSSKERETCNEEKLTCEGCFYNKPGRDEIKQKMASLIISHPAFTGIANDTLQYIDYLEQEKTKLEELEAEHRKINGELRKKEQKTTEALELINSYILEILNKQKK